MCTPAFQNMGFAPFFGPNAAQSGENERFAASKGLRLGNLPLSLPGIVGKRNLPRIAGGRTAQRSSTPAPRRVAPSAGPTTSTRVPSSGGKSPLRIDRA